MIRRIVVASVLVGSWLTAAGQAGAGESYYVLIFGCQASRTRVETKHTWATFVRAVGEGPDLAGYQLFAHTISLVPADHDFRPLATRPEPSANLDLEGSLAYARDRGADTTAWGPFPIRPEVYGRSVEVWNLMQSGTVGYRAIDLVRQPLIFDCIHAVTVVDPVFGRTRYPIVRNGKSASRHIARHVLKVDEAAQAVVDQPWIPAALGLYRPGVRVVLPSQISRHPVPFALGIE